ncbi:MAG: ABC transporter substrate-binding protein [Acidimicrobiales bacterium]
MQSTKSWVRLLAALMAMALVAAACGSDDATEAGDADTADSDTGDAEISDGDEAAGSLADCPNPMVFQTDWFPEPEHGALYNLTAGEGSVDPESGRFTGPLAADPSIEVEIRAGGPFIGFQPTVALMATDSDIFMGYVNTDEAIQNYAEFPTTAVVAPLDINPQIILWDPETYDIESWDDVKGTDAVILHFGGASYTEYLIGSGLVNESQLDGTYDGSPTRFIAEDGAIIQQAFVTQEPFSFENVFTEWGKPVDSLLIHDSGYELYQGPLAILDSNLDDTARSCLKAFVPVFQQSIVDFQQDPVATNAAILQAVVDLDSFWQLSEASVANTVVQMGALNVVGNGPNQTIGDFDIDRVNEVIKITADQVPSVSVPEGLTAEDLVTNEFIDSSIGL